MVKKAITRRNVLAVLLTVVALVSFFCQAWATPTNLNPSYTSPANAGDGTIRTWLIGLINGYNTTNSTALPTSGVGALPDIKMDTGAPAQGSFPSFIDDTLSITLPADLDSYLVLHWGGQGGGVFQAFDLSTMPELYDSFNAPGQNGLSSYAFYHQESDPVPEPGTIMLLGAGFLGLAIYSKRRKNA